MRVPFVDLGLPHRQLRKEIGAAIDRVIETSAFIGGEEVEGFEREFADYCGVKHCVGVGNGTDALVLALRALQVGPGDMVLTVPFTFAATVEAIDLVGATPAFVDIEADDYTIDVDAVARVLERQRVKAIIAVHLYGYPADMQPLLEVARRRGVAVVEDAAQAHGARVRIDREWRRVGGVSDVACFSFYPTKNLGAMGDAGAVTTNDDTLASRIRLLHDHGQSAKYAHTLRGGLNSRLDGLQAAILRIKLRHLDAWNDARRRAAARYAELLRDLPARLPRRREGAEPVFHQYVIRVADREAVRLGLAERGIQTGLHYPTAVHRQEAYAPLGLGAGSFPVAERCAAEVLSLPLWPEIAASQLEWVAAALRQILLPR